MSEQDPLLCISPLDGRYAEQTAPLASYFSEYALIRARVRVEVGWFAALVDHGLVKQCRRFSKAERAALDAVWQDFDLNDARRVKALEATTNHDVKACEYFLRECFANRAELASLAPAAESLHFAATSEDINNLSYGIVLRSCLDDQFLPLMEELVLRIAAFAEAHADIAMLARTHGQAASPTTLGKEFAVFASRLRAALDEIKATPIPGKCNGAVGNFNAHLIAFPDTDWQTLSAAFVERLGLTPQVLTTQIEPHDHLARLCHACVRFHSVLLDLNRDVWSYIALGFLKQRRIDTETGSSTMPHKINPIDFENSEGNLGVANALLAHLAEKLPVSRWQRDLSDSTAMRNIGVALGHSWLAMRSTLRGLGKIEVNEMRIQEDLAGAWEVLGEAAQTILRREGVKDGYERLKALTRGQTLTEESWRKLIGSLALPKDAERVLLELTPATYTGMASRLAKKL